MGQNFISLVHHDIFISSHASLLYHIFTVTGALLHQYLLARDHRKFEETSIYPGGDRMTESTSRNAPLSPYGAFIVQFGEETQLEEGQMVGRVEHVVSWQAIHFASLDTLLAILARVLREVQPPPNAPHG
jgi:hypothetical protein